MALFGTRQRSCLIAIAALVLHSATSVAAGFKIGVVASLTGPAAPFSREVLTGFEAYVKAWNARGGYQSGKVTLETVDDETNPVSGVTNFRRVAEDPTIPAMIIAGSSQTVLAIKQVADEFKIPMIGTGTVDELAVPPAKYFFRGLPGTIDYMGEVVRWAKKKNYKEIAILNPTDAAGQREAALLKQLTAETGIKLVAAETYNPTDTNFTAQLLKIRSAKPEFLYAGTLGAPAVLVFKQIKQMQLSMPVALHSAAFGGSFFTAIGGIREAEGVFTPLERGALADGAAGESARQYQTLNDALGQRGNQFQTVGWDFGILLEHALNTSDGTRDGIRNAIEGTKDLPVIGGFFSYTPANHGGKDERGVLMGRLKDGKFVTAP